MRSSDPLISVVIVSFNQGRYLAQTLQSIIGQTYRHKQVIVIDGGSSDSSVDVIKASAAHLAYWVSEPDGGQSDAIIKGFARADGPIVGWVNSDDLLYPNALSWVADQAKARGVVDGVFFGGFDWIDEDGRVVERYKPELLVPWIARPLGIDLCQPGTFFGREAYARIGGLDRALKYAMDRDLFLRFAKAGVPFIRIAKPLAQFRKTRTQKGHAPEYARIAAQERAAIDRRYGLVKGPRSALHRVARQVLRIAVNYYPYTLWYRLRQGRLRQYSIYGVGAAGRQAPANGR